MTCGTTWRIRTPSGRTAPCVPSGRLHRLPWTFCAGGCGRPPLPDLDSGRFAVRRAAEEELERLGELAAPALRKARDEATSLESRRRLDQLLERLERPPTVPEQVRSLRAVEMLEHMAGREAEEVLRVLARGVAEAPLTQEAKRAL